MIKAIQIAPAVRASFPELFGLEPQDGTKKLIYFLRKLGYDYVFDTPFGADLVTYYEALHIKDWLKKRKLPLINSCCIGWLTLARTKYRFLKDNISPVISPQMAVGMYIKKYFLNKEEDIEVHALMPCAIKFQETFEKYNGIRYVDKVITMRELQNKIHLSYDQLGESDFDGIPGSSEAARFGITGGVTESLIHALSFVYNTKIDFKLETDLSNFKEYSIRLFGKSYKLARVFGISHFDKIISNLKKYMFIEFMACPFGCIGGNAQPIPNTKEVILKRISVLKSYSGKCKQQKKVFEKIARMDLSFLSKDRFRIP